MPPKKAASATAAKKAPKKESKPEPKADETAADDEPDSDEDSGSESEEEQTPKRKKSQGKSSSKKQKTSGGPDKNNMAYNKGDYVIRLSDLEEGKVQLWRVDNYQLLQKYTMPDESDNTRYKRTQYYTGWQCHQKWKFLLVQVNNMERKNGKEETLEIRYPTAEELDAAKKECNAMGDDE